MTQSHHARAARDEQSHAVTATERRSRSTSWTSGPVRTQQEIADMFGVTRQAVADIEAQALANLREGLLDDPKVARWLADRGLVPDDLGDEEDD